MNAFFSSPTPRLRLTFESAIATISIDNPAKRNAVDLEMWKALPPIMAAIDRDERIRVVILRGGGVRDFTAGADIAEFETVRADARSGRLYEAANEAASWAVAHCAKPVIAMIRGYCLGGGFGLAVACDLRVASDNAVFGIPAAKLGVGYPPGAAKLITAAVGGPAARDLFYTARRVGVQEAKQLGVVQRVVPDGELESAAVSLARGIAENAPLTIRAAKAAIDSATGIGDAARDPVTLADICFDSQDAVEGRQAFLEKRAPVFTGR